MINIDNLNQITRFERDEQSHIVLNKEICKTCDQHACISGCPAKCYTFTTETKRLDVAYENCLECGTCLVICDKKALEWTYPRGGFGVEYRLS
jgi:ferredoxin like protein